MPFLIGTDEAGYGPNLGPLIVAATVWQVDDATVDLFHKLKSCICAEPRSDAPNQITIADSKLLYQSRGSIAALERSVLTMLRVAGLPALEFRQLAHLVCGLTPTDLSCQASYDWNSVSLPVDVDPAAISALAARVAEVLTRQRVACCDIRCTAIFPEEFNGALKHCGNKATLLTTKTCQLVGNLLDRLARSHPGEDVLVLCDRHGGRQHYAGLLQHQMTEHFVQVLYESSETSAYRWRADNRCVEVRFHVRGERWLPVALASMTAKYLRELCMGAWNEFWQLQLPQLRPTAGYPQDARRFKREIAARQAVLGIPDQTIWRGR